MVDPVAIVRDFRRLRALVIGDAMLDAYLEGHASRLCREGPVPIVRRTAEELFPGGAANTAANLRALGADVAFLSVVGDDLAAASLRTALRERGVDDRWLLTDPSFTTLHKLRILADEQYVVRFDSGEAQEPSPEIQGRLLASLEELFPQCDLVVVSDYCYGAISEGMLQRLRELRRARSCVLVADAKQLHRVCTLNATAITPNHLEALLETGGSTDSAGTFVQAEVEAVGRSLLERVDAEWVALTLAGNGAFVLNRSETALHLPAHPVSHANDVGAGDSFTAALSLALAAGAPAVESARIAIEAAGIAVTKRRTAVVNHGELLQRVSLEDREVPLPVAGVAARLAAARSEGKRIVFTNGVFDILHAGHVRFLQAARNLGDVLVVGVNSDASARHLKGSNRPINGERDRLALVAALEGVDHVVAFNENTPSTLIRVLRPDIHAKGGDYADEDLPEAEAVREVGGRIVILPLAGTVSTSGVIDRIVALAMNDRVGVGE